MNYKDYAFRGTYAVISEYKNERQYLFLGNGHKLSKGGYEIAAGPGNATAILCKQNGQWFVSCNNPVTLTIPVDVVSDNFKGIRLNGKKMPAFKKVLNGKTLLSIALPAIPYTRLEL